MSYWRATKLIDDAGAAYGVKQVNGKPRISAMPYAYDIGEGNIADHQRWMMFGYNGDVDAAEETVWAGGGAHSFPAAAAKLEVASNNASDTGVGAGARTVKIVGLASTHALQTATVTLNGSGAVSTTSTFLHINAFYVATAGVNGCASGTIDCRHLTNTPVYSRILPGRNGAQQAYYSVPSGVTVYVTGWGCGVGNSAGGRSATFRLIGTLDDNYDLAALGYVKSMALIQDGSTQIEFTVPIKFPATADIWVTATGDAANADAICTARVQGWMETE